jgi:hypothetical protein
LGDPVSALAWIKVLRKHKRPVGSGWRMNETYIKVKGDWKYLYRAVDKQGKTVDVLLTAKRDKAAALGVGAWIPLGPGLPQPRRGLDGSC